MAEPEDNRQTDLNPGLEKKDSTASEDRFFLEKSVYGEFSDRALGLVKQVGWVVEECRTIKREAKKNDEGKMAAFILEGIYQKHEQSGVDSEIEKWEGILERLQKDGTVIDPFLVSALEDTINGEHYNRTLQRTFYFEFVKKVVPQVVILQEEFRNIPIFYPRHIG